MAFWLSSLIMTGCLLVAVSFLGNRAAWQGGLCHLDIIRVGERGVVGKLRCVRRNERI